MVTNVRDANTRLSRQLFSLVVCLAVFAVTPNLAAAEETHLFNATLSLTGDCSVSSLDPVPDPGCPAGAHPPSGRFVKPFFVAVDQHGDRYIGSWGGDTEGEAARIDVYSPSGEFLTEIQGPIALVGLAVDSQGNVYVGTSSSQAETSPLFRFAPTKYNPEAGEIEYGQAPTVIQPQTQYAGWPGVAINAKNDHLFVADKSYVYEYSSAAEGNEMLGFVLLPSPGQLAQQGDNIAIDSVRHRIYVSDWKSNEAAKDPTVKVFDLPLPAKGTEAPPPRELLFTVDGSNTPAGAFTSEPSKLALAVDEATGHFFVGDLGGSKNAIYEFDEDGAYISTIEHGFAASGYPPKRNEIEIDNGPASPTRGFLFVPSAVAPGHSYAFEPKPITAPPVVETVSIDGVTDLEAVLHATVNPSGLDGEYRIEYATQEAFDAEGFASATLAGAGKVKASSEGIPVDAPASGLEPGRSYRIKVSVTTEEGGDEAEASFTTYIRPELSTDCPNQALRTGPSALLPDCRAYELVTPANTNGHPPYGQENAGERFPGGFVSPDGNTVSFQVQGGLIPGLGGTSALYGDPFRARRGGDGWQTETAGPDGSVATSILSGSPSPDQSYLFWSASGFDSPAAIEGGITNYLQFPDGHTELLGEGSIGTDPEATGRLISEGATHVIFETGVTGPPRQLEPNAPPDGTTAVYDRTSDGTLHVVSLLPGDIPLKAGQNGYFEGSSLDGEDVAFTVGDTLYLRQNNTATYEIGVNITFAGIAEDSERVFYLKGKNLYAFDFSDGTSTPFTQSGDVTVVNVSSDGSAAYFVSPQVLPADANPEGNLPEPGGQNLYRSEEGAVSFVGTVTQRDVEGEVGGVGVPTRGLGLWLQAQGSEDDWGGLAIVPSRTTNDGSVLLFESRAPLTRYDSEGHSEVYRYDAEDSSLRCLSCVPTGIPATGEASLQSLDIPEHFNYWNIVHNLSGDGDRAFFESTEPLVLGDVDGLRDVYEWEEEGVGDCRKAGGCVSLISSGASGRDDYLYAATDSGDDVFVKTADLLLPALDPDETISIYDARVGGGFPPPQGPAGECLGEACQPAVSVPNDPTPASSVFEGQGNVPKPQRSCPRGKRKIGKGSRSRCVRHHKKVKHHKPRQSGAKRRSHR
jgi:hypothetical protein